MGCKPPGNHATACHILRATLPCETALWLFHDVDSQRKLKAGPDWMSHDQIPRLDGDQAERCDDNLPFASRLMAVLSMTGHWAGQFCRRRNSLLAVAQRWVLAQEGRNCFIFQWELTDTLSAWHQELRAISAPSSSAAICLFMRPYACCCLNKCELAHPLPSASRRGLLRLFVVVLWCCDCY